jgi:thioredoxin 1
MVITSKAQFIETVASGRTIVKFSASWCKPCKAMEPILSQLETEKGLKIGHVDVELSPALAEEYGVQGLPLLAYYVNGVCQGHLQGGKTKQEIVTAFRL